MAREQLAEEAGIEAVASARGVDLVSGVTRHIDGAVRAVDRAALRAARHHDQPSGPLCQQVGDRLLYGISFTELNQLRLCRQQDVRGGDEISEGDARLLQRQQLRAQVGVKAEQRAGSNSHVQRLTTDAQDFFAHRQGRAHDVQAAQAIKQLGPQHVRFDMTAGAQAEYEATRAVGTVGDKGDAGGLVGQLANALRADAVGG